MTPEGIVKAHVKAVLKSYGAHYQMPVTGGYGRSGASDFLVCYRGFFIAIECKADKTKKLTPLQENAGIAVRAAGGWFLTIHDTNVHELTALLDTLTLRSKSERRR